MATKTGIGSIKHKLTGLRRNSAEVLKKTNNLVSGAIGQLKRTDKTTQSKSPAGPTNHRKAGEAAKPSRTVKAAGAKVKVVKAEEAAPAPKKTRAVSPAAIAAAAPIAANDGKTATIKSVRAAAAAAPSPVKTVVAPMHQRVGSVLDLQLPSARTFRRLAPMNPSPESRASRATSKGKHAALSAAKAVAIQDAGTIPAEGTPETV